MLDKNLLNRCWEIDSENVKQPEKTYDSQLADLRISWINIRLQINRLERLLKDLTSSNQLFCLKPQEPFLEPVNFTPTAGANPDDYLFFDTLHPTETGHAFVSDLALETLAIEAEI